MCVRGGVGVCGVGGCSRGNQENEKKKNPQQLNSHQSKHNLLRPVVISTFPVQYLQFSL